jgi:antitoxin (DNA-binding transcriptional repressor) of toxin-antitoxin stability system
METFSIRNLLGSALCEYTRRGNPLVIANHQALISIVIPVRAAWVEHIVDYNWARVRQSIAKGERVAAATSPTTLDDVIAEADAAVWRSDDVPGDGLERLASPLAATSGRTLECTEIFDRLQEALNPLGSTARPAEPTEITVFTLCFDELSPRIIEQAGKAGQILALTEDGESVGIVIPFARDLVEYLLGRNISRVLDNIAWGEKELSATNEMTTLDEVDDDDTLVFTMRDLNQQTARIMNEIEKNGPALIARSGRFVATITPLKEHVESRLLSEMIWEIGGRPLGASSQLNEHKPEVYTMREFNQQTAYVMDQIEKTGPALITSHNRFVAMITPNRVRPNPCRTLRTLLADLPGEPW